MERMDDGVTRRLQVDTACIKMMVESLEESMIDDGSGVRGDEEIEVLQAESVCREMSPDNMLLELI